MKKQGAIWNEVHALKRKNEMSQDQIKRQNGKPYGLLRLLSEQIKTVCLRILHMFKNLDNTIFFSRYNLRNKVKKFQSASSRRQP